MGRTVDDVRLEQINLVGRSGLGDGIMPGSPLDGGPGAGPFPDIAVHVIEAEGIGQPTSDRLRSLGAGGIALRLEDDGIGAHRRIRRIIAP